MNFELFLGALDSFFWSLRWYPGVSVRMSWPLASVKMPLIALRVVWGVFAVMETFLSQIVFTSVDFPLEGLPIIDTVAHFIIKRIDWKS